MCVCDFLKDCGLKMQTEDWTRIQLVHLWATSVLFGQQTPT